MLMRLKTKSMTLLLHGYPSSTEMISQSVRWMALQTMTAPMATMLRVMIPQLLRIESAGPDSALEAIEVATKRALLTAVTRQ